MESRAKRIKIVRNEREESAAAAEAAIVKERGVNRMLIFGQIYFIYL